MASAICDTHLESTDGASADAGWSLPYALGFQVSLTSFLLLEILLGCSSNLMVLALYCSQPGLVDSVSTMVTMNLHVLDTLMCLVCVPLTIAVLLLAPEHNGPLLGCFHEACVTFGSLATAANLLVVSLDRYDISVRPGRRMLTPSRTALLLAAVWLLSLLGFFLPFLELEILWGPRPALCLHIPAPQAELATCYHLLLQIPAFTTAGAVMLLTYARVLRALDIRLGGRRFRSQRRQSKRRKRRKAAEPGASMREAQRPVQVPSALPPQPMRVQVSVSVIVALRRAIRQHRDRRERQKRVFRMSLVIVSTFLVCWAPISIANLLVLCLGPSRLLLQLRLCFLALAYGTTVFHPLLYAFARQKLHAALRSKLKKRVVSALQVDPAPGGTVIHNSWMESHKGRQAQPAGTTGAHHCLTQGLRE
ncbi:G-protein coupled receptor 22-like [Chelonoidis abingdonii]|uniref:G-protein coupled receptors family 1 profile domain-containing protein n=1 Tax=Chelonoidis abingdonii TaxID=106734 RepID=A0A8C0HBZ7_CHEAB|nr:G-protein coupled receptor 22-like [Chelonoidis abingdonii]